MNAPDAAKPDALTVAFVCVENAGRSQMAAAFAERAIADRDLGDRVTVVSGGTEPAERVHDVVVEAMTEVGLDVADRRPRTLSPDELAGVDVVVTMGCSADDICPATWRGDARDWDLDDPAGRPLGAVRTIRKEVEHRVEALLDELAERVTP